MILAAKKHAAIAALVLPLAALTLLGFAFLSAPCRPSLGASWHRVRNAAALAFERPQLVEIGSPRRNAWMRLPDRPIGRVFLSRRPTDGEFVAFHAWHHPMLRIGIVYDETRRRFRSTCWRTEFDLDGKEVTSERQAPTGFDLESLPVHRTGRDVWIRYPPE